MLALPQQALLLWRPHQVTSLCSHFATWQSLTEVHICRLPVRIWPCTRFSGPYHVIAPLLRDRYSEIINRQHEDFLSPKAKGKEVYFSFPETLGISPICHCSLSREAGFPGWGNQAFKWIPPRGLLYWDLQTGKNPGEKGLLMGVHVLTL